MYPIKQHKPITTPKGTELPLMDIKGKPYLQVGHRLVWFREERPEWTIETEIHTLADKGVIMKAIIKNEDGRVIAMAHKKETQVGFADYIEKGETGAIGRALAMCGFGTQFSPELDEGERLADAPIDKPVKKIGDMTDEEINFLMDQADEKIQK